MKNYPELCQRILNAFISVLVRGRWGDLLHIEEEKAELELYAYKPGNTSTSRVGGIRHGFLSGASKGSMALPTSGFGFNKSGFVSRTMRQ